MDWEKVANAVVDKSKSALERFVMIKLAERQLKETAGLLVEHANNEYKQLAVPGTAVTVYNGLATLSAFTPKSTWTYTPATMKLAEALKKAQADEQATGAAKKTTATVDPTTDQLFAVKLAK